MSVIRWEDPPGGFRDAKRETAAGFDHNWAATVAAQLRGRPAQWALIWEADDAAGSNNISLRICGSRSPFRSFEAATRKGDDGIYRVYARYVGEGSDVAA